MAREPLARYRARDSWDIPPASCRHLASFSGIFVISGRHSGRHHLVRSGLDRVTLMNMAAWMRPRKRVRVPSAETRLGETRHEDRSSLSVA